MVSVMSQIQDNTARIKAEKELEETNRNLEKIVEERTKQLKDSERLAAIGQVAGMVGHDIRNPLQAIVNELYLERDELINLPDNPEKKNLQESINFVEANLFYIDKIVQDLQDYTRPIKLQKQEMNIQDAVGDALLTVIVPSNIQVSISVNENLTKFEADPSITRRILTNLMQNALQAMPNGGQLTLSAQKKGKKAILTIEDTGVGIPDELKSKMFKPLFTTKAKGQGFGLPVVKRLVEAQGGKISFESKEGKGTKFIIELPLR
jgi:signal transduction histidine kinase